MTSGSRCGRLAYPIRVIHARYTRLLKERCESFCVDMRASLIRKKVTELGTDQLGLGEWHRDQWSRTDRGHPVRDRDGSEQDDGEDRDRPESSARLRLGHWPSCGPRKR